jgi:hypothetical protein
MAGTYRIAERLVAVGVCLTVASNASAQKKDESGPAKGGGLPSSVKLERKECRLAEKEVSELLELYGDFGNWAKLQEALQKKIGECTKTVKEPLGSKAASEAPYLVTLVTPTRNVSVVVPQNDRYNPNMPGGPKSAYVMLLVESHAAEQKDVDTFSLASTKIDDPVVSQIPAAVTTFGTAITGGLLAFKAPLAKGQYSIQSFGAGTVVELDKFENVAFISAPVTLPSSNVTVSETGKLKMWDGKEAKDVDVSATFTSKKLRHAEFTGVAGAFVGSLAGDEKMKVDGDKYASDPLKRAMTMVAIAWHPKAYDDTLPKPTKGERTSILLGGVLTPAPGLGAGVSVLLMRGIALNVGGAAMFVPTSRGGLKPKDTVPDGNNQLRYGWTAGMFTGINYIFKGN